MAQWPFLLENFKSLNCAVLDAGLPDGLFSNQKSQVWVNFGGP
jgi:hypothetical protein